MTFDELHQYLTTHDKYLLLSHADPDGDAIGSQIGLHEILTQLGKNVLVLNADASSAKFMAFDTAKIIRSLEEGALPPNDLSQRILVLLDTSDYQHTHAAKDVLLPFGKEVLIIDHHTPPSQLPRLAYIDDTAAASSQIVFELAQRSGLTLSKGAAAALFMGIVYDTGSFIYPKTSPVTFDTARCLVELGVKPIEIHSALYETIEPSRMRLLALVQSTLTLSHDERTAFQLVTQEMLAKTGSAIEHTENFINYPLKCTTVLVSVLMKEVAPGKFRCSLRSKGVVDISGLALSQGGGGHRTAAGFPCPLLPLDQLIDWILQAVVSLYPKD
ncbi:MAG: bifunctional oligoribonuclease/PAP phosphatase NrnA [Spirochaetales bacterium]